MRMAAYCRVSTDRDEQLSSLENQKEFFEQYARKNGDMLVEVYADEGISGRSMKKRDAFMRLLRDSELNKFDYVAVKDISRFARNTSDFLYGIRTLRSNGTDVRFLSGNMTVIGESEFVLTVFAALAQEESSNLSKRVIFGKKQNARKGRVPNIIYGYDKADTFTLEPNPEESAVVRLIYKWYTEGEGARRIADKLNGMGIPTKKNAHWTPGTIRRILQNPVYTGMLINNKSVTKDFLSGTREELPSDEWYIHERPKLRIISSEEFELVQKKLAERREFYKNENHRYSCRHIFSNLIKCGECGGGFTAKLYKRKNTYVKYCCVAHNNGGNAKCSNNAAVDERELILAVKRYLISVIKDGKQFFDMLSEQDCGIRDNSGLGQLEKARKRLEGKKEKLRNMYLEGLMDMEELKKEYKNIDNAIGSIDDELNLKDAENIDNINMSVEDIIMKHKFTNEDMRRIIDKIIVRSDRSVEIFINQGHFVTCGRGG